MPIRKKTTPRMAHYHYFYELYRQKMHYQSAMRMGYGQGEVSKAKLRQ